VSSTVLKNGFMMTLIYPKQATIGKKKTEIKTDSKPFQTTSTWVKRHPF